MTLLSDRDTAPVGGYQGVSIDALVERGRDTPSRRLDNLDQRLSTVEVHAQLAAGKLRAGMLEEVATELRAARSVINGTLRTIQYRGAR